MPLKSTSRKITNVTRDTNVAELVMQSPDAAEVMMDFGLHCVGCFASSFDTIEMGARIHGMSDSDITELLERLNEVVNYGE